MSVLVPLAVAAAVLWIFSTTPAGKRLFARFGGSSPSPSPSTGARRASEEDHAFLLRACGGDYAELERRLRSELERNPELSEAGAYRKAIRRVFNERDGAAH